LRENVYLIGIIILFSAFITNAALSGNTLYARYPALSPDGKTIAFTYRGDIWTVPSDGGEARCLTVHEAEDIRPQFSPDGRMILFSSRRYGNYDIFIMPVEGGVPKQLTFHSGRDIGTGWFPQSDSVLFTSSREGWRDVFKVSIDGGTPIRLTGYPYEQEYNGKISTDGRYLLFNNGSGLSRWWRRDLKASRNTDIFLQDRSQERFTSRRLTDFSGHDIWPILNGERREIYFVSCRGEWAQVWKMPIDGGEAIQLTDFACDGVQWLNSNPQGTMLVFEQGFHIWTMDPADSQPHRVDIQIQTDERKNLSEKKTFKGKVEWYSLSPDEKKIAAVIHGEIFVIPAKEPKEGMQVTFTSAREQTPVWGSDSKTLYYSSDRNGNYDIYSVGVTTREESRLTDSPENEVRPLVSPDGNYLVFYRGLDKIIRLDLGANKEVEWVSGMFFDLGVEPTIEYGWSPDSRWLAFTMAGPTYETDIYAISLEGKPQNLSRFAEWNHRPRFSEDGKTVYFTSTFNDNYNTWKIDLIHKPPEFFEASFDSLFMEEPEEKEEAPKKDDKAEKERPRITKIDFDRIEERRGKAYELSASSMYPVLTPDGAKYLFVASVLDKPEIWSVNIKDEPELKQITKSGRDKKYLTVTKDSKEVLYLEEGEIKRTKIEIGDAIILSFTASLEIDVPKLNRQKFNESWQMLNTYFYDNAFHGADWRGARDKYEPVLDHVRTEPEFMNLIKEMMGELRASHLNIYPRREEPDQNVQTGETGIIFDYQTLERDGHFLIADIVGKSPADLGGIKPGQYITAVNGKPLSPNDNIFKALAGTADKRLILTVNDKPDKKGREYTLKPVKSITGEVYKDRVEEKRHLVDSLSCGRLAYIHIPAMSTKRLEAFKEELISIAEPKEALIIDVRDNSGGYIAVHLLGILIKTPYFLRNFRDFPVTSENKMRSKALEKPMALLINNYSASNSEIFAEGFRKLKLGKIIGEPTAGAVIGTSSYALIDGARIRRPSWGAFTLEMEDTDIKPRYPDIFVENLPDDFINDRDPQLVRSVEELMKELE
jgi:tricorn protease